MTTISHSRPSVGQEEIQAVTEVLRSGQLAEGPCVDRFEKSMAAFMGIAGGVAVSSGTVALELALRALGVGPGDNVILPSYVCAAPWLAVQRVGAQGRLVDVDPETFNIDPQKARKARTARTRAIIVPHMFGLPADLSALQALGVPLIEDCAHTLGATERDRAVGTVGALAVCSFYATKLLCTGEGGMVLSNDGALLEKVRALRAYDGAPSLVTASCNYKMTDVQAAIGLAQLTRFPAFLARRAELAVLYRAHLSSNLYRLPVVPEGRTHIYYRFVLKVPSEAQAAQDLTSFIARLDRQGIQCRKPVFRPLHRYLDLTGFPVSDEADQTALSVPLYPTMEDADVVRVARVLTEELA